MDKEELAEIIGRIRADIGHDDARVRICDVVWMMKQATS